MGAAVYYEFLAKGIDKVLGAPCDDKLVGIFLRKADGVANDVTPQSARRADDNGIVLSGFNAPQWHRVQMVGTMLKLGFAELVHGNKLVEHAVVEHQEQGRIVGLRLNAKEPFAGVVGLHVVHVGVMNNVPILLTIGRKRHSAMEEHLQIGPNLVNATFSADFEHPGEHTHHP